MRRRYTVEERHIEGSDFTAIVSRDRWRPVYVHRRTHSSGRSTEPLVHLAKESSATRNPIVITSGSARPSKERRENGNSLSLPWHRTSVPEASVSFSLFLFLSFPLLLFPATLLSIATDDSFREACSGSAYVDGTRDTCTRALSHSLAFPSAGSYLQTIVIGSISD